MQHYINLIFPGRGVRRAARDTERGDVRPERVRHAGDGARAGVVRCDSAHGVRGQRGHLLRHSAHAHAWTRPQRAQVRIFSIYLWGCKNGAPNGKR